MTIVKIGKINEMHQIKTNHLNVIPDGYVIVPPTLEDAIWDTCGYCDLIIKNGVLIGFTPTERPNTPAAQPSETEQLRADIDFLALMTGVTL